MDKKKNEMFNSMKEFTVNSLLGIERVIWKEIGVDVLKEQREKIRNKIVFCTMTYLNVCYKALCYKNDECITTVFDNLCNPLNHSPICILNMCSVIFIGTWNDINRNNLDFKDKEIFTESLRIELEKSFDKTKDLFIKSIGHKCKGTTRDDLKWNGDMFKLI